MEPVDNRTEWATAAEFTAAPEAHIAMGMLEASGIPCRVDSPLMSTLYGAGSTWAPVRLLVPANFLLEAQTLLADHHDA